MSLFDLVKDIKFKEDLKVILWHGDSAAVRTGYGRVTFEILMRLYLTGKYKIVNVGINDKGLDDPVKRLPNFEVFPLPYIKEDPYGSQILPKILSETKPDIIISINDIWTWTGDERAGRRENWFLQYIRRFAPYTPWIGYFPIDGRPLDDAWIHLMQNMNRAITYSQFGVNTILAHAPEQDIYLIHHGIDNKVFKPVPDSVIQQFREHLGVKPGTFMVGCVSRNQPRKNVPKLLQAFKLFHDGYNICAGCGTYRHKDDLFKDCELCGSTEIKETVEGYSDSVLYLHMNVFDIRGYNLVKIIRDYDMSDYVIVRPGHNIAKGVPEPELNLIYNAMDVHFLPTYAEGFGLPILEAMAAGTPNIVTRTTAVSEMIEEGGGIAVPGCDYIVLADTGHCRKPLIDLKGAVNALHKMASDVEFRKAQGRKGVEYASKRSWDDMAKQFDDIITEVLAEQIPINEAFSAEHNMKVMIILENGDAGDMLALTPVIHKLRANIGAEVALCIPDAYHAIFEHNNDIHRIISPKHLKIEKVGGNVKILRLDGQLQKYEEATRPYVDRSNVDIYLHAANMYDPKEELPKLKYIVTKEERKFARDFIQDKLGHNNVIGICSYGHDSCGIWPMESWAKFTKRVQKDGIGVLSFAETPHELEGTINISRLPLRQQIALLSECKVMVASDNPLLMFAGMFGVPIVGLFGPSDAIAHVPIMTEDSAILTGGAFVKCIPCWKNPNQPCMVTRMQQGACMEKISAGTVYAKVRTILKGREKKDEV
jgi:glycosyltransferase involved in cell wall biosynthesis/ADP-heptose:LPS heptosyltransferase